MVFNTNNSKQHNTFNVGGNIVLVALLVVSLILVFVYTRENDSGALHSTQGDIYSTEVSQLINEERKVDFEYHNFGCRRIVSY